MNLPRKIKKQAVVRARCEPALKEQIDQIAQRLGIDPSNIIRMALREGLNRVGTLQAIS